MEPNIDNIFAVMKKGVSVRLNNPETYELEKSVLELNTFRVDNVHSDGTIDISDENGYTLHELSLSEISYILNFVTPENVVPLMIDRTKVRIKNISSLENMEDVDLETLYIWRLDNDMSVDLSDENGEIIYGLQLSKLETK